MRIFLPVVALLATPLITSAASKATVVSKWGHFEAEFKSSARYSNPVQDVTVTVVFVSPRKESHQVEGFWDGGKTWRARFSPDLPGRWTFRTSCSDKSNSGLGNQSGEFICTAPMNKTSLDRHGPVRVAADRRHFEHADGNPFLWLGDSVWEGARRSSLGDWQLYANIRAQQRFTAAHWTVAPGPDLQGQTAYTVTNGLAINVEFFQRLDAKVEALNRAGLLSAIVPLQGFGPANDGLAENQATLLMRYAVARWSAHHVAWLLAFEGDSLGKNVERWKRVGRAVFGKPGHAPVVLLPGETHWLFDEFRNESWVDAFGFPTTTGGDDALQWLFTGPLSVEWQKSPPRPIINLSPPAEQSSNGDDARRWLWWSALINPTAGASYAAQPLMRWNTNATTNPDIRPRDLPQWRESLFLPGAKSVAQAAEFFGSIDFWRLRPAQNVLLGQPGLESPKRHISMAKAEEGDLAVMYVPEDRTVEVPLSALPQSPSIVWINARTGERSRAVALVGADSCKLPTPEGGDWLLVLRARNR